MQLIDVDVKYTPFLTFYLLHLKYCNM